jgi:OOP family OmpA-OmpF porin
MAFALTAMEQLPRSKVSVSAGRVSITAIADSVEDKAAMEKRLTRASPPGLRLSMNIAAPRPVITPFTLRFLIDEDGARFDACSADTEEAKAIILASAKAAGLEDEGTCVVGMGVPSTKWAKAVDDSIKALAELGGGSVTISNADINLIGATSIKQGQFDHIVGELETALPEAFALHAKLPEAVDPNQGPPEFTATLSPEGQVQLRGRLSKDNLRTVVDSYAKSRFGSDKVYIATRLVDGLPNDWAARVLTGIEALSGLTNGTVRVTPTTLSVRGNTGDEQASRDIASLLATKLGEAQEFEVDVAYLKKLDPIAGIPTPDECEAGINVILDSGKISFEPGSATIDATTLDTLDKIAELLKTCGELQLEIQGHTDSQGREEMNLALSQSRAESVLNELRVRRVPTSLFSAQGYGETQPIQDNGSEDGREANRRIEFRLIRPAPSVTQGETTLESISKTSNIPQAGTEGTSDEQN